ncbi:MAG: hypothetical protein GTN49_03555 [candidate division Zixibacteria bacterium]|nr:hypothetical protein [candidate division Zixibacteria bacterium]
MDRTVKEEVLKFATAAALLLAVGAVGADEVARATASSLAAAAPAATVEEEYELINATPCVDGGEYVPCGHYVEYEGDVIYEVVTTRCAECREDRLFYFDLTPRFGKLGEFREAKLASRAVAAEGELPCPGAESAVTVDSITEEYVFLETTLHSCGTPFASEGQALLEEGGHHYDVLSARCPADGAEAEFYFNIDSFMFNPEKYPELTHLAHQGEPPEPLAGRTLETAYRGPADEQRKLLAEATHAADGGDLSVVARWTYRGRSGDFEVVDTTCEKCGTPVRLYFRLGD